MNKHYELWEIRNDDKEIEPIKLGEYKENPLEPIIELSKLMKHEDFFKIERLALSVMYKQIFKCMKIVEIGQSGNGGLKEVM